MLSVTPGGDAFLSQLQKRDSVLIADQLEYGFVLQGVGPETGILLPDFSKASNDTLSLVRGWQLDTLPHKKKAETLDIRASIVIAPFEEGEYELPALFAVLRRPGGDDTLSFTVPQLSVKTLPVDTASFEIHDIKPQRQYPVTFRETLPYIGGTIFLAAAVAALVWYLRRRKALKEGELHREPAYIIALRDLEKYRTEKMWVPEKQKTFYSGVTDTLRVYMRERFGIGATEMTTAEVFSALKGNQDLTPALYEDTKELFETADFVKFAKYVASDQQNAKVLPCAVRFVTETYKSEPEEGQEQNVL